MQNGFRLDVFTSKSLNGILTCSLAIDFYCQEMLENVKKCKNFLATLIKLASSGPRTPEMGQNVKNLVQSLLVRIKLSVLFVWNINVFSEVVSVELQLSRGLLLKTQCLYKTFSCQRSPPPLNSSLLPCDLGGGNLA